MGAKRLVILIGLLGLVVGLIVGLVGGYYYKDFRAAEDSDPESLGGGSYFTQNPYGLIIAVIDPDIKRPRFSSLTAVGSYGDIFTCPTSTGWRNVTPSFIWNGQNLGKIFPKKVNTAELVARKEIVKNYSYPGPLKKVRTEIGVDDVIWFGEEYLWKVQELDTNKDGQIDYIEAVNTSQQGQGQDVDAMFEPIRQSAEGENWAKESTLLGLTRIAQDNELLKPIPLCKKTTGSGE